MAEDAGYTYYLKGKRTLIRRTADVSMDPERFDLWSLRWVADPALLKFFMESPFEIDALDPQTAQKMEKELRDQFEEGDEEDAPVDITLAEENSDVNAEPSKVPESPSEPLVDSEVPSTPVQAQGEQMTPEMPSQGAMPGVVWHVPGDMADGPDVMEDDGESITYEYDEPQDKGRLRRSVDAAQRAERATATPEQMLAADRAKRELRLAIMLSQKRH